MNQILLNNAFVRDECERKGVRPAALDTYISETYAQQNEDLIVEALLKPLLRRLGRPMSSMFYVEIGANHPFQTSNTYLFYRKHGARGVLVEANRALVEELRTARPGDEVIEAAVSVSSDDTVTFHQCEISELSGLNKAHIQSFGTNAPVEPVTVANLHINTLLDRVAKRQIDYLSIDVEGLDLDLLKALHFEKYRPYFIQCEPSEHFHPGASDRIASLLETKGYTLVARTDINLIFAERTHILTPVARRTIRTFDVFDTLIARKCIDPLLVFARVEQMTKHERFAADRRRAEQKVATRSYTIEDIYNELKKIRGWSQEQSDAAQAAEIFAELETVVPIAENIAQVRDGDIAVSEMYLPECVLRMMLKKAGLNKEIGLIVNSNCKTSGDVWPKLLADYQIEQHIGDNFHTDVQSPDRFGIAARHTLVSRPDAVESWLMNNGIADLARIVRQARLSSWHDDTVMRKLQLIQVSSNFPLLVLSSILLARFANANNIEKVLFCSRDCNLWQEIFPVIRRQMRIETSEQYFHTSRQARMKASPSYRRYVSTMLNGRSVVVDICGSGWSLSHLLKDAGLQAPLYFLHHLPKRDEYENARPTPDGIDIHSIVTAAIGAGDNEVLEMANYADHAQIADVSYAGGAAVPVFAPERRSASLLAMVREQAKAFRHAVAVCDAEGLSESLSLPDDKLRAAVFEVYQWLYGLKLLPTIYGNMHADEEAEQLRLLKKLA